MGVTQGKGERTLWENTIENNTGFPKVTLGRKQPAYCCPGRNRGWIKLHPGPGQVTLLPYCVNLILANQRQNWKSR